MNFRIFARGSALLLALLASTAQAQSATPDRATPIRVRGVGRPVVGTLERVTADSLTLRVLYTEYHGPRPADVVFWGTERLLVGPVRRRSAQGTLRTIARRDITSVQQSAGEVRWPMVAAWTAPLAVMGATFGMWGGSIGSVALAAGLGGGLGYIVGYGLSEILPKKTVWHPLTLPQ